MKMTLPSEIQVYDGIHAFFKLPSPQLCLSQNISFMSLVTLWSLWWKHCPHSCSCLTRELNFSKDFISLNLTDWDFFSLIFAVSVLSSLVWFSIWNYLKKVLILNGVNLSFLMLMFHSLEMIKTAGRFCRGQVWISFLCSFWKILAQLPVIYWHIH